MNPFILAGEKQECRPAEELGVTELGVCQTLRLQTDLQTPAFQRQAHDLPADARYIMQRLPHGIPCAALSSSSDPPPPLPPALRSRS